MSGTLDEGEHFHVSVVTWRREVDLPLGVSINFDD